MSAADTASEDSGATPAGTRGRRMVDRGVVLDTITGPVRTELVEQRSRFIADLAPVADVADAEVLLARARREFHAARHHCSAFVLGPGGEHHRSSDDGEPAGTAGAPMLAVLQGERLTDVAVVVSRYFGGTLLGSGGLVRAYGGAVTAAVGRAQRVRRRRVAVLRIEVAHAVAGRLEHRLRGWAAGEGARVEPAVHGQAGVTLQLAVPLDAVARLRASLDAGGIDHALHELGTSVRPLAPG